MGRKSVAILQSNYIPWKGYFDIINTVDEFIFYDEVQYTKNDWRNRNKIKSPTGPFWLTIPVNQTSLSQTINQTTITDSRWRKKHLETFKQFYRKAPFFKEHEEWLTALYDQCTSDNLSEVNLYFIQAISEKLDIKTKFSTSEFYGLIEGKSERLVDLVLKAGGSEYVSGPAAKDYLDTSLFEKESINVRWMDYSKYPAYDQLFPPFAHGVSALDVLFNVGEKAADYCFTN